MNLSEFSTATDYLASSDTLEIDFDVIREALKTSLRANGWRLSTALCTTDSEFRLRSLAQRAQCYLLLGQPDKALRELTLIHDLCRLLEGKPTGKPMTLVAAMINVAVTGLYLDTVADGTRLQMWREPQLTAIQGQLKQVNLTPLVMGAFESQRAAVCRTFDTSTPAELAKLLAFDASQPSLWQKIKNPMFLFFTFVPRGWVYQNMTASALLKQKFIEGFDPVRQFFRPPKLDKAGSEIQMTFSHFSPYTFLARIAVPNFTRAWQTLARNQSLANEGQIVCALERYRIAHGDYPESLDALVPQFIEKTPPDIIGGQPLKYRRTDDRIFLLYSIGWNEKDDDGQVAYNKDGSLVDGDWVWGRFNEVKRRRANRPGWRWFKSSGNSLPRGEYLMVQSEPAGGRSERQLERLGLQIPQQGRTRDRHGDQEMGGAGQGIVHVGGQLYHLFERPGRGESRGQRVAAGRRAGD